MRLRAENGKLKKLNLDLGTRLERMRSGLGVDLALWSEILGMSAKSYCSALQGEEEMPLLALEALTHHLGISLDVLIQGEIDYAALLARFNGDASVLPEKYNVGAFSRRRTSINVLAYLQSYYGWRIVEHILRRLQVSEAAFADPEAPISISFLTDVCNAAGRLGADESVYREMGRFSAQTNRGGPLGQLLGGACNLSELYAVMIDEASSLYDKNCDYSIGRLDASGCTIAASPSDQVRSAFGSRVYGSSAVCLTKAGVFSSAATYIGAPNLEVREEKCIHRGDPRCEYRILFPERAWDQAAFRSASFLGAS